MNTRLSYLSIVVAWLALNAIMAQAATYTLGSSALLEGRSAGIDSVGLSVNPTIAGWTASADDPWLHLSPAFQSGTGSTNLVFSYDANTNTTRIGTLTIGGQTLMVTQAGSTYVAAAGPVTTLANSGLNEPEGVAVDRAGNVYFADANNNEVKEWIAASNAVVTVVASGLNYPGGVAVDDGGNVYIADSNDNSVKEWIAASNTVVTLVSAGLSKPFGLAVGGAGNNVYIADASNNAVKEWDRKGNALVTLVSAGLNDPQGVAVDGAGNVYIADHGNGAIKEWMPANSNLVTRVSVGTGPEGVAVDGSGNVYFAATANQEIQKWTAASSNVTTLVFSGLSLPSGVAVDSAGNIYFANWGSSKVQELPRAFVDPTAKYEEPSAGSDVLPVVLPVTENLQSPFAPTSDQSWLSIAGVSGGVVSFDFTANPGASRTANISLLGTTIPVTQSQAGTLYVGGNLTITSGAPDNNAPLVILGEYSQASPLTGPGPGLALPAGTVQDVKFFGDNYDFTLYQLSYVNSGPFANEQNFQVVQSQHFSGSAATGIQTLPVSGFVVPVSGNYGTILAFAGIGPYYPQVPDDALYSDATYENATEAGSFAATPPGGVGDEFVVGLYGDNAYPNYDYIPDTFQNQGRAYAIGVDVTPTPLISSFSPASGNAPQALRPGTMVTIQGVGFSAGSQVMFGNSLAWVDPSFVSADGTEIQAQVPRYGTTGNLQVSIPGGATLMAAQPFTVNCYRNTDGYSFGNDASFQNSVGGYSCNVEDTQLFGSGQTEICWSCDPCLCLWSCNGCLDNPFADLFVFIANQVLPTGGSDAGQCFGFSLSSQRFIHGDEPYNIPVLGGNPFPIFPLQPGLTSDTVWNLQGPNDGYSPEIASYIHVQHMAQLSVEFLLHYAEQVGFHAVGATSESISNSIRNDFNNGDHPIMAVSRGSIGNGFEGHVLVAYDLEAPTNGSSDYCYIDVYDCDIPYVNGEDTDTTGSTHLKNEQTSRIILKKSNQWSYSGVLPNAPWGGGGFAGLVETDYGVVPVQPTMPGSPNSIFALLTTLIFSGVAQPTQVSDDAGHVMFNADGTPNLGSGTSVPLAAPFAPLNGTNAAVPLFLFGTNGTYHCTVTGVSNGAYSANVLGNQQYMARVINTPISTNGNDTIHMVTTNAGLGFSTDSTNKPLTLQVLAAATNGMIRSAILSTTTFGGGEDSLVFADAGRQTVTFIHSGPATSFTLTLWQVDRLGKFSEFISTALNVDTNGSVTFALPDGLPLTGSLTMISTNNAGQQQQTTIQSASPWQFLPNGAFSLTLHGNIGLPYLFEASTNLASTNWVPLGIVTNLTGIMQFTDTNSPQFGARFYRAVQQ